MNVLSKVALVALVPSWAAIAQAPWQLPESDYGGAVPRNLSGWYNYTDYPDAALRAGERGYVTISFTIGVDGRMRDCQVVRSSSHATLDAVPCKVLPRRARFYLAKDANGAPVATHGSTSMAFWTQNY